MATKWALAFAHSGSFLARQNKTGKPETFTFAVLDEDGIHLPDELEIDGIKLFDLIKSGDELFAEMGGHNGPLLAQAVLRDVKIFQIPIIHLKELSKEKNGREEVSDEVAENATERNQKSLAARKARCLQILELAYTRAELFNESLPTNSAVWKIGEIIRIYVNLQKDDRIKAQHRCRIRQMTMAWLPYGQSNKLVEAVQTLIASPADVEYYLLLEKSLLKSIEKELPDIPIWQSFLEEISGIGPSLAGRIIGEIGDIRRFPHHKGFRKYCGFSVKDGKMPKLRRKQNGEEGARDTYSPNMRQALFLFSDQIVKRGDKNPYNSAYVQWKQYYTERDQETLGAKRGFKMMCHRRGLRAATSDFVDDLWYAWWKTIEDQGGKLPVNVVQAIVDRNEAIKSEKLSIVGPDSVTNRRIPPLEISAA